MDDKRLNENGEQPNEEMNQNEQPVQNEQPSESSGSGWVFSDKNVSGSEQEETQRAGGVFHKEESASGEQPNEEGWYHSGPKKQQENTSGYNSRYSYGDNGAQRDAAEPHIDPKESESYKWNYEDYKAEPKHTSSKNKKNKGLRVFTIIMCAILCAGVISLAGYGTYALISDQRAPQTEEVPSAEAESQPGTQLTLNNKPDSTGSEAVNLSEGQLTITDRYNKVLPSTVGIVGYIQSQQSIFGGEQSQGSGIILSADGYIVTNAHVVSGATSIKVVLNDNSEYNATVVGSDEKTDLAVLKIDATGLTPAEFGNSDQMQIGEQVIAIGNPGGLELAGTLTVGYVSAVNRPITTTGGSTIDCIQTDAAINPGNSGGALVNTRGELVGINTLIKSQTGSYVGYSFAIPESIVRKVVVDLKEFGVVQRALLGVQFRVVDQDFLDTEGKELGIKDLGGAYVAAVVEGGAASEAGIRKGDVILDIDGVKIVEPSTLQEQIAKRRPNDTVKLSVKRDGKVKQFDVTLRNKAGKTELVTKEDVDVVDALGGKFADAGAKLCRELDIKGGVQVVGIKADGILARARVKQGFVITHINDRPVYSLSDMERMTDKVRSIDGIYPNGRAASYVLVE